MARELARTGTAAERSAHAPAESRPPRAVRAKSGGRSSLLDAEVRRIMRVLRASGPLRRDMLARRCHASAWHGSFERAVNAGVRQGALRALPFGFVGLARRPYGDPCSPEAAGATWPRPAVARRRASVSGQGGSPHADDERTAPAKTQSASPAAGDGVVVAPAFAVLAGLWLAIAPWVLGYERTGMRWNDVACGVSVVLLALLPVGIRPRMIARLLPAIWLLIAAFTIDPRANEIVNDVIVGAALALLSLWALAATGGDIGAARAGDAARDTRPAREAPGRGMPSASGRSSATDRTADGADCQNSYRVR